MPRKQREYQEQGHRPKHQRGHWEQKKCNAAMRLNVWSDLHKRSGAWCYADGGRPKDRYKQRE